VRHADFRINPEHPPLMVDEHSRGRTDHGVDLGTGNRGCAAFSLD
jgi:hypothetical protein